MLYFNVWLWCSYAEAHKIKLKADALEAWELEKWHSTRQQELLQREGMLKQYLPMRICNSVVCTLQWTVVDLVSYIYCICSQV